jgi:RimJ/RimL family protein N-acetyltransferase
VEVHTSLPCLISPFSPSFPPLTPPSLYGASKTPEDTETALKNILPAEGEYRIAYAVHSEIQFLGLITLRSLTPTECTFQPRIGHASTPTTLSLELAYMFLPSSWGHGYATESIKAMFAACWRAPASFWAPYGQVYVRAIVHDENRASQRVMEKCAMDSREVLEFAGGRFFIAGKWWTEHRLYVYGKSVVG